MDAGRLGLLAILYEFIDDNKTVWVVGDGSNRYQFIYAEDLATACILAASHGKSDLFHIGSDNVKSMRQVYEAVIQTSGSNARQSPLPTRRPHHRRHVLAHKLRISPLGPYHYKMIAESFVFDTTRIKQRLGWHPTLTNEEMLLRAYDYYAQEPRRNHQPHQRLHPPQTRSMGVIRLLKWIS